MIIIKIGTNIISGPNNPDRNTPEEIADGISAVCAASHKSQPGAKILLLGILPRCDEVPGDSIRTVVNRLLALHFSAPGPVTYRNWGSSFRKFNDNPNPKLFLDSVHLNAAGYDLLDSLIRKEISFLIRESLDGFHP